MNVDCCDCDRLEEKDVGYDEHLEIEDEDVLEGRLKRRGEERRGEERRTSHGHLIGLDAVSADAALRDEPDMLLIIIIHGDSLLVQVDMSSYQIVWIIRRRRREYTLGVLMLFCQVIGSQWKGSNEQQVI